MPLENSCEKLKGQLVFVSPIIGFGWCRKLPEAERSQPGDSIEPPSPFCTRILEFYYFNGGIRGGVGIIEQQNHSLHGNWVGFCIRDGMGTVTCNFSSKLADSNIRIGKTKPVIRIDEEKFAMPEWIQFESTPFLSGLGYITESPVSLEEIYKNIRTNREP